MKRVVLDGKALAYRLYYADPRASLPGRFWRSAARLYENLKADERIVAWDGASACFRINLLSTYKSERRPTPAQMRRELIAVTTSVPEGVRWLAPSNHEADDVMATLARLATKEDPVILVSDDKDILQCLRAHVTIHRFRDHGTREITEFTMYAEWGVLPERLPDVLALMGDVADCIPGVPGIGKKTACELISVSGSLERLYEMLDRNELSIRRGIGEALLMGREQAFLARKVATLCDSLDLGQEVAT